MDQVVVVTGAADGLGRAFATRFAEAGYQVVAADINDEAGQALVAELTAQNTRIAYAHCDVTDRAQVQALVADAIAQFGAVDVLINNAVPPAALKPLEEKTDEEFQRQLDGGFFAARWAMNAAFESMKARGFGRVINLCSLNGVNAHPQTADYNVAKEARVNKQVPMGYMGDPYDDISGVALFLASKDARYMTGNTLYVDGGGHINGINWASLFD